MKLTREELRLNYNEACNAYLMAFCEKHGFDYADAARSWVGGDGWRKATAEEIVEHFKEK